MKKKEVSRKEKQVWTILAEKSLEKMWANKKDDKVWSKYL